MTNSTALSPELREQRIQTALTTPTGRQALADSMLSPLRRTMELRYFFAGLLTGTARQDQVFAGAEEPVVEEPVWTEMEKLRDGQRFDLIDRAKDMLGIHFGNILYARVLSLVRVATLPTEEPFPEGWHRVLLNIRSTVEYDKSDKEILGRPQHRLQGALVDCARLVEPGLLYAFGKPDEVGRYWYDVQIEDESDDEMYRIKGTLRYRMALVNDPRVAVYRLGGF